MELTLWQELFWAWLVLTIAPKLIVVPVIHLMRQALKDTKRQDEIDAAWLASLKDSDNGGGNDRHPRSRRPWMPGPRRGPGNGTGGAARVAPRSPRRIEARAQRTRRPLPAR
ncbi:MAG: hypothetical protein NTZ81_06030 [Actinobacteria bacterium]|nr:hypothetical protein [Actinomycetota bacterium]